MKKSLLRQAIDDVRMRRALLNIPPDVVFAARNFDWEQVQLHGRAPCFHLCDDGRFCGRASNWQGHGVDHSFVSLADLLQREDELKKFDAEQFAKHLTDEICCDSTGPRINRIQLMSGTWPNAEKPEGGYGRAVLQSHILDIIKALRLRVSALKKKARKA